MFMKNSHFSIELENYRSDCYNSNSMFSVTSTTAPQLAMDTISTEPESTTTVLNYLGSQLCPNIPSEELIVVEKPLGLNHPDMESISTGIYMLQTDEAQSDVIIVIDGTVENANETGSDGVSVDDTLACDSSEIVLSNVNEASSTNNDASAMEIDGATVSDSDSSFGDLDISHKSDDSEYTPSRCTSPSGPSTSTPKAVRSKKVRRGIFTCDIPGCDKRFSRPDRLVQHSRIHTGARPYRCQEENCGRSYTRSQHLKRHLQVSHSLSDPQQQATTDALHTAQPNRCLDCNKTFSSVYSLRKHQTRFHARRKHSCSICGQRFLKQQHLLSHLQEHTSVPAFKCEHPGCDRSFVNPSKLKRHQQIHLPGRFKCTRDLSCKETFDRYIDLRRHIAEDHPYECDKCPAKFTQLNRYNKHRSIHEDQRLMYLCLRLDCGRCYYTLRALKCHIKDKHDCPDRPFHCQHCNKGFSTKQKMQQHEQAHSSQNKKIKEKRNTARSARRDKGIGRTDYRRLLSGLPTAVSLDEEGQLSLSQSAKHPLGTTIGVEPVFGTRRMLEGSAVARRQYSSLLQADIEHSMLHDTTSSASHDLSSSRENPAEEYDSSVNEEGESVPEGERVGDIYISGVGALKESKVVLTRLNEQVVNMLNTWDLRATEE